MTPPYGNRRQHRCVFDNDIILTGNYMPVLRDMLACFFTNTKNPVSTIGDNFVIEMRHFLEKL